MPPGKVWFGVGEEDYALYDAGQTGAKYGTEALETLQRRGPIFWQRVDFMVSDPFLGVRGFSPCGVGGHAKERENPKGAKEKENPKDEKKK